MNYNEWGNKIHNLAVEKGWFDGKKRSDDEMTQLIASEICEATEEVRNSKPDVYANLPASCTTQDLTQIQEEKLKPEGEAVEIADAFIRLLDYGISENVDINAITENYFLQNSENLTTVETFREKSPLESHLQLLRSLISGHPSQFLLEMENYFEARGWDLERIVALKHGYNQTRPYRHGGKAL